MPEVVRLLRQEHANLAMLLDVLERQLTRSKAGEAPDYDIVKATLDYFLTYPDLYHHPKEDLVFLRLRARDRGRAEPLAELLTGHEELALLTRRFARATVDSILNPSPVSRQWFNSLGRAFIDTNRRHMANEEAAFFPVALQVLDASDWSAIDAQISDQEDPLFGGKVEQRFKGLHDMILGLERESLEGQRQ